jgi:hypothetical protein
MAGYTALTLAAGNAFAFFGPLLGGILLDHTRTMTSPFWIIVASALTTVVLGATLPKAHPPLSDSVKPG